VVGDYVWAGTDGGLIRWSANGSARVFRLTDLGDFPDNEANTLVAAPDGTLWIGSGGVAQVRPVGDQVQALGYYNKDDGLSTGAIHALMVDRDGSIWASGPEQVKPPLAHFEGKPGPDGNAWRTDQVPSQAALPGQKLNVRSLLRSRDGGLWVGLDEGTILEWDGKTWKRFGAAEGLRVGDPVNDRIRTLLQDRNGTIWAAATHQGLLRLDATQGRWQRVAVQADAPIRGIAEFADGSLWASGDHLVARSTDGGKTWVQVGTSEGPGANIGSVVQDAAGRVWAGAYDGGISVWDGQSWRSLQR
jgi:ligand-binding sensor domain-containing protein